MGTLEIPKKKKKKKKHLLDTVEEGENMPEIKLELNVSDEHCHVNQDFSPEIPKKKKKKKKHLDTVEKNLPDSAGDIDAIENMSSVEGECVVSEETGYDTAMNTPEIPMKKKKKRKKQDSEDTTKSHSFNNIDYVEADIDVKRESTTTEEEGSVSVEKESVIPRKRKKKKKPESEDANMSYSFRNFSNVEAVID